MLDLPAWLTISILLAEWGVRIGLGVRVIMRRRSVPTSLAWLAILLLAPIVGIVFYALIGESRLGRRRVARHIEVVDDLARRAARVWHGGREDWTDDVAPYRPIATLATHVGLLPPLRGNTLELIGDSETFLARLIEDIGRAESHCHVLTYIWMRGPAGDRVAEALIGAARRGVACRVLADGVGSAPFIKSDTCRRMRQAGVHVQAALPANAVRALFARLDLRNHRKIAVIDGRVGYAGSHNITDETFKVSARTGVGPWIDASVRLVGPAAQALEVIFLHDWLLDAPQHATALESLLPELEIPEGGSTVHVIPSMPGRDISAIYEAVIAAIYMAREEIVMTTPYFVPDEPMRSALRAAALRGVSVELAVPAINDSPLVAAASRANYQDLLDVGAKIWHYNGGLLHAKTLTIDRHVGLIGSANFDVRSFWLNFEVSLFVYDSDFASQLRFLQKHYINDSTRVNARDWAARPVIRRFADNTARLLGPLL